MTQLTHDFDDAMIGLYHRALKECGIRATYFLNMLSRYGSVGTAHELLSTPAPQTGFVQLWQCGRLDLTVEYVVLDERFEPLFEESDRAVARQRLLDYDFDPDRGKPVSRRPTDA